MTVPILSRPAEHVAWMIAGALCAACGIPTQAAVHSDVVTAGKYTQPAGPSAVAFPAHPAPIFTGKVLSVAGNVITLDGPLTAGALNQVDLSGSGGPFAAQYCVKLRHDRSGDGNGTQGDWFTVQSNTANTVTVNPNSLLATASSIAAGDLIQIEKLATLQDVFGAGAAGRLDPDSNFDVASGDVIYTLLGTAFGDTIVYHDGSLAAGGYWELNQGLFLGDGSTYTFAPDQTVFNFNQHGGAYDVVLAGTTQCFSLSHYLGSGLNGVANPFAATAPVGTSGLYPYTLPLTTGFLPESNFDATTDAVFLLAGTSFGDTLIYHDGSLTTAGWWNSSAGGGSPVPEYPLPSGVGFFVQRSIVTPYVWRQPKP